MTPQRAYRVVRTALKNGTLCRPENCETCGRQGMLGSDGRATIHAHHHDYSKPLDVQWLCAKCHRAVTPLPDIMGAPAHGEHNGQAKLTAQAAEEIRLSPLGCRKLAKAYGVDKKTIQNIRNWTAWKAPERAASPASGTGGT